MRVPNAAQLTKRFCQKLVDQLGREDISEINRLNATKEYEGVCATHDFCDANQVMADALEAMGFEYHNRLNEVINSAWDKAKAAGFDAEKLAKPNKVQLATIKREHLAQYKADLTYVVVEDRGDVSVVKLLNFPDRPPVPIPTAHLNIFDEVPHS